MYKRQETSILPQLFPGRRQGVPEPCFFRSDTERTGESVCNSLEMSINYIAVSYTHLTVVYREITAYGSSRMNVDTGFAMGHFGDDTRNERHTEYQQFVCSAEMCIRDRAGGLLPAYNR